jgi:gliding motility-associated lipoprotein GldD
LVEDSRKLAFKHTVKATGINEGVITNKEHNMYGIYYTIDGNTASSNQFFLTDSNKNFLRGALYFNEKPQADSILPVVNFIKTDMDRLIKTLKWKVK